MRYVQRKLRVVLCVFWPLQLKTAPRRALQAAVLWHQNKATQFYLVSVSEFYLVSVPHILYGRLLDLYMILYGVDNKKPNYTAMQNGRLSIEWWLLSWSYRPGYLWKAERISNISIYNNLKKSRKKKKQWLTSWVAERGYDSCNKFLQWYNTCKLF